MKLSRPSMFLATLLAMLSILFMQVAVAAAYACPSVQDGQEAESGSTRAQAVAMQIMTDCGGTADSDLPKACHAHSKVWNPSFERPVSPDVLPAAILLVAVSSDTDPASIAGAAYADVDWRIRASGPSIAIQNCCFRL